MIQNRYAVDFDGVMEENRLYVARDLSTDERVLIKISGKYFKAKKR